MAVAKPPPQQRSRCGHTHSSSRMRWLSPSFWASGERRFILYALVVVGFLFAPPFRVTVALLGLYAIYKRLQDDPL